MWVPYRVRPDGKEFRITYSRWVAVPDGGGCIDWDEETEDTDDVFSTEAAAREEAAVLNTAWHAAEVARRESMRRD